MPRIKLLISTVLGLLVLFLLWKFFLDQQEVKNYPSRGETIIAFGDSLTFGEGVKPEENYVSLLERRLGTRIVNAGVSGDTTAAALKRLPELLQKYPKPKVVIVMLGGNDFLQRKPKEETYANLAAIISAIQEKGGIVLLVGVRGGLFTDGFASEYKRLAKKYQAAHFPNILKGILGEPSLLEDTIHPNARGHAKMADRLEPVLRKLINL